MIRSGLVCYHDALEALLVPIDSVQPHPENYNNGDVDEVAESIRLNGMYRPIETQRSTGYVIAGNTTWTACKLLDAELVPVVALDVDDDTAKAIMVTDNETARLAVPDPALLLDLLEQVRAARGPLLGVGVNDARLERMREMQAHGLTPNTPTWPSLCFPCPPRLHKAFYAMTDEADSDIDRLEVLLLTAGWDPR